MRGSSPHRNSNRQIYSHETETVTMSASDQVRSGWYVFRVWFIYFFIENNNLIFLSSVCFFFITEEHLWHLNDLDNLWSPNASYCCAWHSPIRSESLVNIKKRRVQPHVTVYRLDSVPSQASHSIPSFEFQQIIVQFDAYIDRQCPFFIQSRVCPFTWIEVAPCSQWTSSSITFSSRIICKNFRFWKKTEFSSNGFRFLFQ